MVGIGIGMVGIGIIDWKYQIVDRGADNAICVCDRSTAKWLISRLSLAADLEELTYNVAIKGQSTDELMAYIRGKLDGSQCNI